MEIKYTRYLGLDLIFLQRYQSFNSIGNLVSRLNGEPG